VLLFLLGSSKISTAAKATQEEEEETKEANRPPRLRRRRRKTIEELNDIGILKGASKDERELLRTPTKRENDCLREELAIRRRRNQERKKEEKNLRNIENLINPNISKIVLSNIFI